MRLPRYLNSLTCSTNCPSIRNFILQFPLRLMHMTLVFFTLIFVPRSLVSLFRSSTSCCRPLWVHDTTVLSSAKLFCYLRVLFDIYYKLLHHHHHYYDMECTWYPQCLHRSWLARSPWNGWSVAPLASWCKLTPARHTASPAGNTLLSCITQSALMYLSAAVTNTQLLHNTCCSVQGSETPVIPKGVKPVKKSCKTPVQNLIQFQFVLLVIIKDFSMFTASNNQ